MDSSPALKPVPPLFIIYFKSHESPYAISLARGIRFRGQQCFCLNSDGLLRAAPYEAEDDLDGDGFCDWDGDCDDAHADIYPMANDPVGDDIVQNCDGADGEYEYDAGSTDDGDAGEDAGSDGAGNDEADAGATDAG